AEPVLERGANEPAGTAWNGADLDRLERPGDRAIAAARIERAQSAARERQSQEDQRDRADHATRFTSRSGTMMIFRGGLPSRILVTRSDASAIASSVSRPAPRGAVSVSRSLPLTWIAIVTSSSTR